ncbi:MAG: DUF2189 domain-containing protein [Burkholderiales bacterium]|jgi:uncharacterized membrane protein|nr:DUF2189 domain-containing protein [Burkholderiales bacterium]
MTDSPTGGDPDSGAAAALPFVAPCRELPAGRPLQWVARGWSDFRRAPQQSLGLGIAIVVLSWIVTGIGLSLGSYWAVLVLLSGFVFVAPLLAIGLYSVSRQLERGQQPTLVRCSEEAARTLGNAMVFALALLVLFLIWARAGSMVHVFFPAGGGSDWRELALFLGIGSAVGSIFALLAFVFSAFSLPMICDRETDAVTAIVTSVNAVLRNKPAMAVWALLIVLLTGIGFATALLGLAVTIPVLGHATWHAYRDTIDASAWPESRLE